MFRASDEYRAACRYSKLMKRAIELRLCKVCKLSGMKLKRYNVKHATSDSIVWISDSVVEKWISEQLDI